MISLREPSFLLYGSGSITAMLSVEHLKKTGGRMIGKVSENLVNGLHMTGLIFTIKLSSLPQIELGKSAGIKG